MSLVQSLLNPPDAPQRPAAPQMTFAPPSGPQQWNQQVNQAVGGNMASLAARNTALDNSYGQRYGVGGRGLASMKNKNAIQTAIGNQQARVNIPMQGMQQYSNYMMNYDNALENQFQARQREDLQRQQLGVSALGPLLGALVGFTG